jgi:diamine N-acetyltransferase
MMFKSAEQVVAANLAAYNARDLEGFMACFTPGIEVWDQQSDALILQGEEQVRGMYATLFANSPCLHSQVLHRSIVGPVVIDHEIVTGREGGDLEILITYRVVAGKIARLWVSRMPLASGVTVRAAQRADRDEIAAIGRATYIEHFAHIWTPAGLQAHVQREFDAATVAAELQSQQISYFLAETRNGVIGFAKLRHPRALPIDPGLEGAELQKIYMKSEAAGRGTGTLLLEACVARSRSLGLELLWLDVLERNTPATCFYLRHGFKFMGKESFQTDRDREVMLVMTRSLPK